MANPTTRAPTAADDGRTGGGAVTTGPERQMQQKKTTLMFRNIANPQRTTLAHLTDAGGLQTSEQPEHSLELPTQTANPRRTILMHLPQAASVVS